MRSAETVKEVTFDEKWEHAGAYREAIAYIEGSIDGAPAPPSAAAKPVVEMLVKLMRAMVNCRFDKLTP